jgi:hypothetical protein
VHDAALVQAGQGQDVFGMRHGRGIRQKRWSMLGSATRAGHRLRCRELAIVARQGL